jgi:polysaccharide deacetylase 2 family uncharacterized protein YibQ
MKRREFLRKSVSFLTFSIIGMHLPKRGYALTGKPPLADRASKIALIIDDIGHNCSSARQFYVPGIAITFSLLPRLPYTRRLAHEIRDQGHEMMLHQPMEPHNPMLDPGPGALFLRDRHEKIEETIAENLEELPAVVGVNNHMGSRFTEYQDKIGETLRLFKKRGLFFIDSLTSPRSAAYREARDLRMATACRNIFLDNQPEVSYIDRQLKRLKDHASRYGHAIGIGHPHPETADVIGHFAEEMGEAPVRFVHVSQLLDF